MDEIQIRRSRNIRLGILLFVQLVFFGVFPFVAFSTGDLVFGLAMLFAFSMLGAFSIWAILKARALRFDDGLSETKRMKQFVKSLGGIPRLIAYVIGVTVGTVLILVLGAI